MPGHPIELNLAAARKLFPSIPEIVFNDWLVERVVTAGWPPHGARWNALLCGYSPNEWSEFSWEEREVDLYGLSFSEQALRIIRGLSEARFTNITNAYTNIENSDHRMQSIYAHIKRTRRLPGSVVLIDGPPWEIIDGSHWITMYVAWLRDNDFHFEIDRNQSAWIATPMR